MGKRSLQTQLVKHFGFLADTPGYAPALKAVMGRAESLEVVDGWHIVQLQGAYLIAAPPVQNPARFAYWPASFRQFLAHHAWLSFPNDAASFLQEIRNGVWRSFPHLDGHNWVVGIDPEGVVDLTEAIPAEARENLQTWLGGQPLLCPFLDDRDACWVYHPTDEKELGEPPLCAWDADSVEPVMTVAPNIGSLLLHRLIEHYEIDLELPPLESA